VTAEPVRAAAADPELPPWLRPLATAARAVRPEEISRFLPPEQGGRQSAVLILLGEGAQGPDLLLIERATTLRSHAGQPAFPGGGTDPGDADAVETALREAAEEVGLDRAGVSLIATLPAVWLPPSGYVVVPVLAWWHRPSPVYVADPVEVAAVRRVPIAELADPASRVRVRHPSGWIGPAFEVRDLLVWGFTAGLVDRVLALGGWEQPWDTSRVRELPAAATALAARTRAPAGTAAVDPVAGAGAAPAPLTDAGTR
jgi:8-oxo-dGTP pyrophosphatase MutT (NUDIX family)